ncbi:MAG: beta-hydroxyacyl-ACP dehydratase [Phycisphaerae bacterium]|nr:beta-hydroxyacyl-ACP dehydratase [Phycisphaerae bacterium]
MRWMWIDSIIAFEPRHKLVAIKNVSMAEEHLHDHFEAENGLAADPVMPTSLILEGMAQTAGILVGSVNDFREKVVLAKVTNATISADVRPGQTIRYTATIDRIDPMGASTTGVVSRFDHAESAWSDIGTVELIFSHLDQNMGGMAFPEENFVFGENFRTILAAAGFGRFQ